MAFSPIKFLKSLIVSEENTLTPKEIELLPGGTSGTKTTITGSQTANRTVTLPDNSDTLVGSSTAQTLTNKTIDADLNTITNIENADIKTGAAIDRSKLATGTASTVLINDASGVMSNEAQLDRTRGGTGVSSTATFPTTGVVVTEDATQTLTNKTMDGASNTFSNIPPGAVDLASATTLNEATTNTASTINIGTGSGANVINIGGTNSQINLAGTVENQDVVNLNVADKLITVNAGGSAGSAVSSGFEIEEDGVITGYVQTSGDRNSILIKAPGTAGVAAITPGSAGDTVALLQASQTLLNKDIDGGTASAQSRITLPHDTLANLQALTRKAGTVVYATDTQKQYVDNGTSLVPVGTGGVTNYFPTGDAESGLTVSTYADGTVDPVDGQGGSPTLTVVATSSSPLAGTKSFMLTTGALGNGVSILSDTIAVKDKNQMFTLEVNLQRASGGSGLTGVGEFGIYLLDVSNSNAPVALSPTYLVPALNLDPTTMKMQVQIPSGATQLRLCVHQRAVIGTAYDLKFEFNLVQQASTGYSTIQTDPVEYTPTIGAGFGTASNVSFLYTRNGKMLNVRGTFTTGTCAGSLGTISLPAGLTIDPADISIANTSSAEGPIVGTLTTAGANQHTPLVTATGTSTTLVYMGNNFTNSGSTIPTNPSVNLSNSVPTTVEFSVPILGWSSESQVVSEYDGRVVAASYYYSGGSTSISADTQIDFNQKDIDTHNAVTTGASWKFTAPVAGIYDVEFTTSNSFISSIMRVWKNGSYVRPIGYNNGSFSIQLNVGDYIDIRNDSSAIYYGTSHSTPSGTQISIILASGSQQIVAGQRITCEYYRNSNQTITANSTKIIFDQKISDTTNSYNTSTGEFVAPTTGDYLFNVTAATSTYALLYMVQTGSRSVNKYLFQTGASGFYAFGSASTVLQMTKGDVVYFLLDTSNTILGTTSPAYITHISIKQVN